MDNSNNTQTMQNNRGLQDNTKICINALRGLSIDAIQKANSGHPGLPLGAAPMAQVLWHNHLKFSPSNPQWPDRDRFVMSPGHGSALLYALLHCYGFNLSMDDLKAFRQWGSKTPGHPEYAVTPGVEATTGPLGQGSANAVGMAIAERKLAHYFNREGHTIVDHHTYALVSDGDLMEGISAEAGSLAGHLKLGKLIYLYDANDISLDGPLSLAFTESVAQRYESYGWQVLTVLDGDNDYDMLRDTLTQAKAELTKPTLIIVKTTIGYGSPQKAGTSAAHGSPLGADEVAATKAILGLNPNEHFMIADDAKSSFTQVGTIGDAKCYSWEAGFARYKQVYPDLGHTWSQAIAGRLPIGWDTALPKFKIGSSQATRVAGGKILNVLAQNNPLFFGGDADLSCSTKTAISDATDFEGVTGSGRNLRYGIREHAMGAIANGIAYHGGLRHYTATFFCFADYMRPAIRLAAMNHLPVTFVFTHDSVGVGEDGPTHQPVEHLMSLRCMPNLWVLRPADGQETVDAWRLAMTHVEGPVALVLSRQNLPELERDNVLTEDRLRGGYIIKEGGGVTAESNPDMILLSTGSELHLTLAAAAALEAKGVSTRVVSMPCTALFDSQEESYKKQVLPHAVTARLAVEAGSTLGWERYVGLQGAVLGIDRYGASAPAPTIFKEFGFTVGHICAMADQLLH